MERIPDLSVEGGKEEKNKLEVVNLAFPTGAYYEASQWGKEMELKAEELKNKYLEVEGWVNNVAREKVNDYIRSNPEEGINWKNEEQNFFSTGGLEVIDNKEKKELHLWFSEGKLTFDLQLLNNGKYSCSLEGAHGFILPSKLLEEINRGLSSLTRSIEEEFNK